MNVTAFKVASNSSTLICVFAALMLCTLVGTHFSTASAQHRPFDWLRKIAEASRPNAAQEAIEQMRERQRERAQIIEGIDTINKKLKELRKLMMNADELDVGIYRLSEEIEDLARKLNGFIRK